MVVGAPFVELTMDLLVRRPVVAIALEGAAVQGRCVEDHHRVVAELGGAFALEERRHGYSERCRKIKFGKRTKL